MVPASLCAVLDNHITVSTTLRELQSAGLGLRVLSVIGKDTHTDGRSVGFYQLGHGPQYKGILGAFWSGLWNLMPGSAFFLIPGVGQVLMAGPIVTALVNGYDGIDTDPEHHALHMALVQNHVPSSEIKQYESTLRAGHFLLFVHGDATETAIARQILERNGIVPHATSTRGGIAIPQTLRPLHPNPVRRHETTVAIITLTFMAAFSVMLGGCGDTPSDSKGPAQRAGEATDNAVNKTGDVIKEGVDKTGQGVQKAGEAIQDSTK